jgi:hypothetical protein
MRFSIFSFVSALFLILGATRANAQWAEANGPYGGVCCSLVICDTTLFVGSRAGGVYNSGVYRYDTVVNPGTDLSWSAVNNGLVNINFESLGSSGTTLFAGISYDGVYRSNDHGASWTAATNGLPSVVPYAFASTLNGTGDTTLFVGTLSNGVFLSTDNGSHWTAASTGLPVTSIKDLVAFPNGTGGTELFAGTLCGVYHSTDNGTHWGAVNNGLTDTTIGALAAIPNGTGGTNLFAGTGGGFPGYGTGAYRSTDNGGNWSAVNNGLQTHSVLSFAFSPNGKGGANVYAGTDSGVFVSTNNGANWSAANNDLKLAIFSLKVFGTNLFAGTYFSGVYLRPLVDMVTGVEPSRNEVPKSVALRQNYPNPFNPSTVIRYALPSHSHVNLTIYNTLGQQVATLVNGEMEAGYHEVRFDGSRLASGVYFYRLQAGTYAETRKLLLLK